MALLVGAVVGTGRLMTHALPCVGRQEVKWAVWFSFRCVGVAAKCPELWHDGGG